MIEKKTSCLFVVKFLLAFLLLQASPAALAFTIIEIPDSSSAPSSSVTESTTFGNQIQPVIGALQARLQDARRKKIGFQSAGQGNLLAFNSHTRSMSDADFVGISSYSANSGGGSKSLWFSSAITAFDNDFSRTKYDGATQMLMLGFDNTANDRVVYGFAVSYEASDIDTRFNDGNQEIDGFSINPYFAYLFSDAWSLDLSLGIGDFDVEQFRTVGALDPGPPVGFGTATVTSEYSSSRQFLASNLTYGGYLGRWYLSSWLGLMVASKDQDDYTESDDTDVESEDMDLKRWSLGFEAAFGRDVTETYLGLIFEKDDVDEVEFATGTQPEYDDETLLLSLGWRYFGKRLVANIELSNRLMADNASENSISSTLRLDL